MVKIIANRYKVFMGVDEWEEYRTSEKAKKWSFPHDKLEYGQKLILISKCGECASSTKEIKTLGYRCYYCGNEYVGEPNMMHDGLSFYCVCHRCKKKNDEKFLASR